MAKRSKKQKTFLRVLNWIDNYASVITKEQAIHKLRFYYISGKISQEKYFTLKDQIIKKDSI